MYLNVKVKAGVVINVFLSKHVKKMSDDFGWRVAEEESVTSRSQDFPVFLCVLVWSDMRVVKKPWRQSCTLGSSWSWMRRKPRSAVSKKLWHTYRRRGTRGPPLVRVFIIHAQLKYVFILFEQTLKSWLGPKNIEILGVFLPNCPAVPLIAISTAFIP